MKNFTVIVTRDTTESCVLTIDAEDRHKAESAALEMVANHSDQIGWELDDAVSGDVYVTDVTEETGDAQ